MAVHKAGAAAEMRKAPAAVAVALVLEALESQERDIPDYIEVEAKGMTATYIRQPEFADVPYPVQMEPNLVIEFYSS